MNSGVNLGAHNVVAADPEDFGEWFEQPPEASTLDRTTLVWLLALGVSVDAIYHPRPVHVARVCFDGVRYTPCPGLGCFALIFAVIADEAIIDHAAWEPATGRLATRLGLGACLGEGQVGIDGRGTTGLPMPVWSSPLSWLIADRCGLVIVDPRLAAYRLAGVHLSAEDDRHFDTLSRNLRLPAPHFVVRGGRGGVA